MADAAFLTWVINGLVEVKSEISIFFIAVFLHWVVFGKYQVVPASLRNKQGSKSKQVALTSTRKACSTPNVADDGFAALVTSIERLLSQNADEKSMSTQIEGHLEACPNEGVVDVLIGLLEGIGKTATAELLSAVKSAMRARSLQPGARLGGLLLRGFLRLGLQQQFDDFLTEIEEANGVVPSIAMLALRAALWSEDMDHVIRRIRELAQLWRSAPSTAPTASPSFMLQQLIQLASSKKSVCQVVQELTGCGQMTSWVFEVALTHCLSTDDTATLQALEDLAHAEGVELTPPSYCAILSGMKASADVVELLTEASKSQCITSALLNIAADLAISRNDSVVAREVLRYLPSCARSPQTGSIILRLTTEGPLAAESSDAKVLSIYERHICGLDISADVKAQKTVAEAALKTQRMDVLQQLMASTPESAGQVALLKSFGSEKRIEDTLAIFEACPQKNVWIYNALLDICAVCHDLGLAERIMTEAVDAGVADVISYNTMIKALLQNGKYQRARKTIEAMKAANMKPNVVTFNELLDATIRTNFKDTWDVVSEMQACGLSPNNTTCSILLKSIGKSSKSIDVQRTMAVVDALGDDMDEVLLSSVCEAFIRAGRADLLAQQLQKQRTSKRVQVRGTHTYGSIIRAYGCLHNIDAVWETWREMQMRHVLPTCVTLGCMVEAVATNGDPEAGYELIREALTNKQTRPLVNAITYCSVLKSFSHKKQFHRVWTLYQEMREEGLQFSIVTYNALVDACARCSEMARVPAIMEEMASQDIKPNVITYSTIIKGYCNEARLEEAFKLFDEMNRTPNLRPDEFTYNTLLDGCARKGLYDRGIAVLGEMQSAGVQPSNFTLSLVVKLANRSHKLQRAFELCEELSCAYGLRPNTPVYNNLIHACVAHQEVKLGLQVFEQMTGNRVRPDARTYTLLLRGCMSAGLVHDVACLVRAACGVELAQAPRTYGAPTSILQVSGNIPNELITEALEGIADQSGKEHIAMDLWRDLRRVPKLQLDPKLPMRLTNNFQNSRNM